MIALRLGDHRQGEKPAVAVEIEDALELQLATARAVDLAADLLYVEDDVGKAPALQDLLVHLTVAPPVARVGAGGVEDDPAAGGAGLGVDLDRAVLGLQAAVDSVEGGPESERDEGGLGVELESQILGRDERRERPDGQQQGERPAAKHRLPPRLKAPW